MTSSLSSSRLTPDDALSLLFPPSWIPEAVAAALPELYHIRPLAADDYHRGHLALLRVLTQAPDLDEYAYAEVVQDMRCRGMRGGYFPIVIVSRASDELVGTGTLLVERKFIRNAGLVGHVEDIAVAPSAQGQKLGLRLLNALVGIGEALGCYKTILDCSAENVAFYEKCGFAQKELEMAKYAPTPLPSADRLAALARELDAYGSPAQGGARL